MDQNIHDNNSKVEKEPFDIEMCAKEGKHIPQEDTGARYMLRIDSEKYIVDTRFISGKELLELAKKIPVVNYRIDKIMHDGKPLKIGLDQRVDLAEFGIERFVTIPVKDVTEG